MPPELQIWTVQMEKRAKLLEHTAENVIYVVLPQRAVDFQKLLGKDPMFSSKFGDDLLAKLDAILNSQPIDQVIQQFQKPQDEVYKFESVVRNQALETIDIIAKIKEWATTVDADEEQMECITAILDAAASLEDQCGGLIQKLLSYHITRIRLFHKLVKRKLYDLAKTLALQDVGQVREITAAFEQLHSGMIASYD